MTTPATILVVDENATERSATEDLLRQAGYRVASAGSFEDAMRVLADDPPDLLVTELRLGAFNGLHIVIRSRHLRPEMAAIILTRFPDPVLEAEAHHERASYVVKPLRRTAFLALVARRLGMSPDRRQRTRKPVGGRLEITIGDRPAALIDLSYEGFCVVIQGTELPSSFDINLPTGLSVKAATKWTYRPPVALGSLMCGAAVSSADATIDRAWRDFVDAVPVS
jgi:CheY-like chemotaxis protein